MSLADQASNSANRDDSSVGVTLAGTPTNGEAMLLVLWTQDGPGSADGSGNYPSGPDSGGAAWIKVGEYESAVAGGNGMMRYCGVWFKVAASEPGATYTFSGFSIDSADYVKKHAHCLVWDSITDAEAVSLQFTEDTTDPHTSVSVASATPTEPNGVAIGGACMARTSAPGTTNWSFAAYTEPTGIETSEGGVGSDSGAVVGYKTYTTVAAQSDTLTSAADIERGSISFNVIIQPAAAGQSASIGQASEADEAQSVSRVKARAISPAVEANSSLTVSALKAEAIGIAAETDASQAVAPLKARPIAAASETEESRPVSRVKSLGIGIGAESDAALGFTTGTSAEIGPAIEADSASSFTAEKQRAIAFALEADVAITVARLKAAQLQQALESNQAQTAGRLKSLDIGIASEADAALAVTSPGAQIVAIAAITEASLAQSVARLKRKPIGLVTEVELAQALSAGKLLSISPAAEAELARAVSRLKTLPIGAALEIDLALPLSDTAMLVVARFDESTVVVFADSRTSLEVIDSKLEMT